MHSKTPWEIHLTSMGLSYFSFSVKSLTMDFYKKAQHRARLVVRIQLVVLILSLMRLLAHLQFVSGKHGSILVHHMDF